MIMPLHDCVYVQMHVFRGSINLCSLRGSDTLLCSWMFGWMLEHFYQLLYVVWEFFSLLFI